jgi:acetoin utilization protein AcuC
MRHPVASATARWGGPAGRSPGIHADGRWLFTGGGEYELVQVVPRTWTHLIAEATGHPINPGTPTPLTWREYVAHRTGLAAAEQMTDGAPATFVPFESGYDPAEPADTAIMATRNAVFPEHGLMPL